MPLTLKIKYFNTFILREEPIATTAKVTVPTVNSDSELDVSNSITVAINAGILVGMSIHGPGINKDITVATIDSSSGTTTVITLSNSEEVKLEKGVTLTFSNSAPYSTTTANKEWHIEESRVKGGFNEKTMDFGVKAFAVDKKYNRNHRKNAMIYSGIFNSRTGINNTNQFSIGESITKAVDSIYGSIQKLYAEDTNLLIFQENKVNNALIDKDAIFTAEGGNLSATAKVVIGQITPYLGEFGIGKNPESFAVYGFRKYFVDKDRAAVLRLSRDGLTEISSYGMKSFFRDNLRDCNKAYGMYDLNSKSYVLSLNLNSSKPTTEQTFVSSKSAKVKEDSKGDSITLFSLENSQLVGMVVDQNKTSKQVRVTAASNNKITLSSSLSVNSGELLSFSPISQDFRLNVTTPVSDFKTLSFDDKVNGWSSFFTYKPRFGGSVASNFYTWDGADLYKHYQSSNKNTFYGVFQPSTIKIISNQNPSMVKHYKTINYEGTNNWKVISFKSPADDDIDYKAYPIPGNITGRYIDPVTFEPKFAGFTPLEKKYYANVIINDTSTVTGISSLTSTGVKGFFAETILEHQPVDNSKKANTRKHAELFSVGFNYEQSLY